MGLFSISSLPEPQYNSIHPPFEVTTSIQIQIIMSDIAKGVGNLFAAVVDIIKGIFATVFNLFQTAINTVIGLFKNVFNLAEGVVGFIIGNIFIIGTLCTVYFGYQLYQQRQGKNPAPISRAATKKTSYELWARSLEGRG